MNNADLKWRVAASLQSLIWFFAVPTLLKPHWEGFWSGYSPLQAQVILNEIGMAYFAVAALLMVPIYAGNYPFFEKYKISDQEWHWRSEKPEVRAVPLVGSLLYSSFTHSTALTLLHGPVPSTVFLMPCLRLLGVVGMN
jgi:hypothetical protein